MDEAALVPLRRNRLFSLYKFDNFLSNFGGSVFGLFFCLKVFLSSPVGFWGKILEVLRCSYLLGLL